MNPPQPPHQKQEPGESSIADRVLSEDRPGAQGGEPGGVPDRAEWLFFLSALLLWLIAAAATGVQSNAQSELRWTFSAGRFGLMHLGTVSFALLFWTLGLRAWSLLVSGMMPPGVVSNRSAKLMLGMLLKLGVLAALVFFIGAYPNELEAFCLVSAVYLLLSSFVTGTYYFNFK